MQCKEDIGAVAEVCGDLQACEETSPAHQHVEVNVIANNPLYREAPLGEHTDLETRSSVLDNHTETEKADDQGFSGGRTDAEAAARVTAHD